MEKKNYQVDNYLHEKRNNTILLIVFAFILIGLFLCSIFVGNFNASFAEVLKVLLGKSNVDDGKRKMIVNVILNIRLPRTFASILIGSALSLSGLTYQCVFRNMLVSQDVLGVSTGASVGAALAIVFGLSSAYIQSLSFGFGIMTMLSVFVLSAAFNGDKTLSLILSGILISGLMSSVLSLIKYTANPETHLQSIVYWLMGDLSNVSILQIKQIVLPVLLCMAVIIHNRWMLNFFAFSDTEAVALGINIKFYRMIFLLASTLLVSFSVSVAGTIGWIGLVIPQLVRTLMGNDNIDISIASLLLGADFLLLMDILNRIISTAELPISILTGIFGTPIFVLCLLIKQKKEYRYVRG